MAEKQFQSYYYAYIDSARKPSTGKPPEKLLRLTYPGGAEEDWLKNSYASGKKSGGHIKSGNVKVTLGPEIASNGSKRTTLKFRACIDPGSLRVTESGKITRFSWQMLDVEMRAKGQSSKRDRATDPEVWLVYSANQTSSDKCGF